MSLHIYNTLSKRIEEFKTINENRVNMFVCGPTVYGLSHIGHAKTYTQFDFIARYLKFKGYEVNYLQNITDIDDKIIRRANETGVNPADFAKSFFDEYLIDMKTLDNSSVTKFAPAHDYIDAMVHQVQQLTKNGIAYELEDGWYYDTTKFKGYGKLSGRVDVQEEDSVARIDDNDKKRNASDFALWKFRKPNEPFWETPIGAGRPGWHIEDTAITEKEFGTQYDLHGGAVDLIFPHHENEIAQIEGASGKEPMVRCWMHTGLVRVQGAKMSKSADNFITIREILKDIDVRTLRYIFLSQHYRSSVEINSDLIIAAKGARRRIENFYRLIDTSVTEDDTVKKIVSDVRSQFFTRLDNDFDTPGAFSELFEFIREQNKEKKVGQSAASLILEIEDLFGAFSLEDDHEVSNEILELIKKRNELKTEKKYEEADSIRAQLLELGILLEDKASGTLWRKIADK